MKANKLKFSNSSCLYIIGIVFLLLSQCTNTTGVNSRKGNHLAQESSPYLLQHAHNPVDWYPWKDEALEEAIKSRKLLIISIGYSSCHWCHVMERETFSDTSASRIMNQNFISIKVDREERPDVDQIYMNACQVVNGGACGWPLNIIAMPDGRPVWIGTYLTREEWIKVLNNFQEVYNEDPNELEKMALRIQSNLSVDYSGLLGASDSNFNVSDLKGLYVNISNNLDYLNGGKSSNQKFPLPVLQRSILEYGYVTSDKKLSDYVRNSLNKMAFGGINDHIEGGFFRYTVDSSWRIPHFEKMLYDNAQLISLYSEAYQNFKDSLYRKVVELTIDFCIRNMRDESGGFYSSFDAESEGEEGKYYYITLSELEKSINDVRKLELIKGYYSISAEGNWEKGKNVLIVNEKKLVHLKPEDRVVIQDFHKTLREFRSKRTKPNRDGKILTSWNALMLKGLLDAYAALGNESYKDEAIKLANHLKTNVFNPQYGLFRNYMGGKASIPAFLEDYAITINSMIRFYELSFDESYLHFAKQLTDIVINQFSDDSGVFFFYNSNQDRKLINRKIDLEDQVIPSSNSFMAENLSKLGSLFYNQEYLSRSNRMISSVIKGSAVTQMAYYSNWARLGISLLRPYYEVAIVGLESPSLRKEISKNYIPHAILLGGNDEGSLELLKEKYQEGSTYIYVCRNKVCKLPVQNAIDAMRLMNPSIQ